MKEMNKIIIPGTIIIIVLMIGIPTFINVTKDHEKKLIKVSENKIKEAAKKCFLDGKCEGSEITLQTLYDLKYLENQVNPTTKKYYDSSSIIKYEDKKIILDLS